MLLLFGVAVLTTNGLYAAIAACVGVTVGEVFIVWHGLAVARRAQISSDLQKNRRVVGTYCLLVFAVAFFTGVQVWFLSRYLF